MQACWKGVKGVQTLTERYQQIFLDWLQSLISYAKGTPGMLEQVSAYNGNKIFLLGFAFLFQKIFQGNAIQLWKDHMIIFGSESEAQSLEEMHMIIFDLDDNQRARRIVSHSLYLSISITNFLTCAWSFNFTVYRLYHIMYCANKRAHNFQIKTRKILKSIKNEIQL